MVPPDFVSRVSNLPLVNTALRAYEQGKASSRVVKVCASAIVMWFGTIEIRRIAVWSGDDGVLGEEYLSSCH